MLLPYLLTHSRTMKVTDKFWITYIFIKHFSEVILLGKCSISFTRTYTLTLTHSYIHITRAYALTQLLTYSVNFAYINTSEEV